MEQGRKEAIEQIASKDNWSQDDYHELVQQVLGSRNAADVLGRLLSELRGSNPQPKGAAALKIAMVQYAMSRPADALKTLASATDNRDRHWLQAQCHKVLRRFDEALESLQRARAKGMEGGEIELEIIEVMALSGKLEEARRELKGRSSGEGTARVLYIRGLIEELGGMVEQAGELYEQAVQANADYAPAVFRLAYFHDLHGNEPRAIELYQRVIKRPPVHVNALLNLAVLYDDAGRYDEAIVLLRRILAMNPQHERAKLFIKDAESSKTMFYDEDQAKAIARRNAVLDIPVTDFELSVRARNCLKKMNIRTLGDLVKISEAELLSYKNFGETSLKEIKDMLSAKGLRLGQALEEGSELAGYQSLAVLPAADQGMLSTPLSQIEFSVRARRALESLGITNLGDLHQRSEAELLGCKNFGQTSLNEVKQRLAEYGLTLRNGH